MWSSNHSACVHRGSPHYFLWIITELLQLCRSVTWIIRKPSSFAVLWTKEYGGPLTLAENSAGFTKIFWNPIMLHSASSAPSRMLCSQWHPQSCHLHQLFYIQTLFLIMALFAVLCLHQGILCTDKKCARKSYKYKTHWGREAGNPGELLVCISNATNLQWKTITLSSGRLG